MIRSHVAGILLLTLLFGTAVADTDPLNFTVINSETGPGVPPLPPLVWHLSGPDGAAVIVMEVTPQLTTPSFEQVWSVPVVPELIPGFQVIGQQGFDPSGSPPTFFVIVSTVSIAGEPIQISNTLADPTGEPNLMFDATIPGVGIARFEIHFSTDQPAEFIDVTAETDTSSLDVALSMDFSADSDPDIPIFTGTMTAELLEAVPLIYDATVTETAIGEPPMEWEVSAVPPEPVYTMEMTVQESIPEIEMIVSWISEEVIWATVPDVAAVPTNTSIFATYNYTDISNVNDITLSHFEIRDTGSFDLLFDAEIEGLGTAFHNWHCSTEQAAGLSAGIPVPNGSSFDLAVHLSFTGDFDDNKPLFTCTLAGNFIPILPTRVGIDIKPGSDPNCFNINGHGVIPVAILGSSTFDVSNIDQSTLSFGGREVRVRGNKWPSCGTEDANSDGLSDLVCHFEDNPDYWSPGSDEATLTGSLLDGTEIEGTDTICVVP